MKADKVVHYIRALILISFNLINLESFCRDYNFNPQKNSLDLARLFLKALKQGEIYPGKYASYKFAHKINKNFLIRRILGVKLFDHLSPKYGDFIFNKLNNLIIEAAPKVKPSSKKVSIVIPTYGSLREVETCLDSIAAAKNKTEYEVYVIDDASPEKLDRDSIERLCQKYNFHFFQNKTNVGFIQTVNFGFTLTDNDVVLLNSDTEVYDYWLDALLSVVDNKTGTVTPLSNNASIYSFKTSGQLQSNQIREFCRSVNSTLNQLWLDPIEIPTAHGFCMFISRNALNLVGNFDAEIFGMGYGEENDFSMRVSGHGLKNLLTTRTIVYHKGSASFGDSNISRKMHAEIALDKKWPNYKDLVRDFLKSDLIGKLNLHVRRYRMLNPGHGVSIHISHGLGGGTDVAVRNEISSSIEINQISYWIKPSKFPGCISLYGVDQTGEILLHDSLGYGPKIIGKTFNKLDIKNLVIHHEHGFEQGFIRDLLIEINVSYAYRIHDYYNLCPFFHLVDESGNYCGEPDNYGCNACISSRTEESFSIQQWRGDKKRNLSNARSITAPTLDVIKRFNKYYPELNLDLRIPENNINKSNLIKNFNKTIVVIGAMSRSKGSDNLVNIANQVSDKFRFLVVGWVGEISDQKLFEKMLLSKKILVTGWYQKDDEAINLINLVNPAAFLFPTKVPETYSYTLDIALQYQCPIIACDLGAFSERIPENRFISFKVSSTAAEIARIIEHV